MRCTLKTAAARTEFLGAARDKAGAEAGPELGALRVRVMWSDDTPAGGVAVSLRMSRPGFPYRVLSREVTDREGVVRFTALSPGKFSVRPHRGGYRASAEATVVGAGIWLTSGSSDWLGGRIVTRSDAKGEFRIRSAQKDASIGAIVAGFTPSPLVDLDDVDTARSPVSIRLTVREAGGGIEGTITAPSGDTVAGAVVCVGAQPRRFRQRRGGMFSHVETWTPLVATTDTDGHYALLGVAPGEQPIHVRAEGLALYRAKVSIDAGVNLQFHIQLSAGYVASSSPRGTSVPRGELLVRCTRLR